MREARRAAETRRSRRVRTLRRLAGALVVAGIVVGIIVLVSQGAKPKTAANHATTSTATPKAAAAPTCPPTGPAGASRRVTAFTSAPPRCISLHATYRATVVTDVGTFVISMPAAASPAAVNSFVFLARYHFYDGTVFHRVIPGFVVQGGDPTGTGTGGPGYRFTGNTPPASCARTRNCYRTGTVALANSSGPSTDGSQFFVVLPGGGRTLDAEPNYTIFGRVVRGMAVVERIGADGSPSGTPKVLHRIVKVTITQASA